MNDPFLVRRSQSSGDVRRMRDGPPSGQWSAIERLAEGFSIEKLGHNEWRTVVDTDVKDRADIWMAQRSGGACLALETRQALGIG